MTWLDTYNWLNTHIQPWQTLIGAMIALLAAIIAVWNTSRTLKETRRQERLRRGQKLASIRVVLPLVLSEASAFSMERLRSIKVVLDYLSTKKDENTKELRIDHQTINPTNLKQIAEFIEYADGLDVRLLSKTLQRIQIAQARTSTLDLRVKDTTNVREYIEEIAMLFGAVHAGLSLSFDYARGKRDDLPRRVEYSDIFSSLKHSDLFSSGNYTVLDRVMHSINEKHDPENL